MSSVPVLSTIASLRETLDAWRREGIRVGFVPTMGYLHEGHLSLIRYALTRCDRVVVSIFVNPTQFGPKEDLESYPRDPEGDRSKVEEAGGSLIFQPNREMMYPLGAQTFVEVEEITRPLCGQSRATHFRGVTTVVCSLFHIVEPDVAVFGKKDYQQLVTIQRMVRDLHLRVHVLGAPIVREQDGLAMSSRNVYLSAEDRRKASCLNLGLRAARRAYQAGERKPQQLLAVARQLMDAVDGLSLDYLELRDGESLNNVETSVSSTDRLFVAARLGMTRLIDNAPLGEACSLDAVEQSFTRT